MGLRPAICCLVSNVHIDKKVLRPFVGGVLESRILER